MVSFSTVIHGILAYLTSNVVYKCTLSDVKLFISRLFDVEQEDIASRVSQSQYVLVSGSEIDCSLMCIHDIHEFFL